MDVPVLTMDAGEALGKMEIYRDAVRKNPDAETADADRTLYRGFKALAKGMRLVNLDDVFRECTLDDKGRPKLAVCRADAKWCIFDKTCYTAKGRSSPSFYCDVPHFYGVKKEFYVSFSDGILGGDAVTRQRVRAMLPSIPPDLRPIDALSNYHVLWEAEWQAMPPRDPFLLKHLDGPLYIVCAEWDLTDLEMSVLAHVRTAT